METMKKRFGESASVIPDALACLSLDLCGIIASYTFYEIPTCQNRPRYLHSVELPERCMGFQISQNDTICLAIHPGRFLFNTIDNIRRKWSEITMPTDHKDGSELENFPFAFENNHLVVFRPEKDAIFVYEMLECRGYYGNKASWSFQFLAKDIDLTVFNHMIWILDRPNKTILCFSLEGDLKNFISLKYAQKPFSIAVHSHSVYVAYLGQSIIEKYSYSGEYQGFIQCQNCPISLFVTRSNVLFATTRYGGVEISINNSQPFLLQRVGHSLKEKVQISRDGRLFCLAFTGKSIQVYGSVTREPETPQLVSVDEFCIAAQFGDLKTIRLYLETGGKINALNHEKHTALYYTARYGSTDAAQWLINHRAMPEACKPSLTEVAQSYNHRAVLQILQESLQKRKRERFERWFHVNKLSDIIIYNDILKALNHSGFDAIKDLTENEQTIAKLCYKKTLEIMKKSTIDIEELSEKNKHLDLEIKKLEQEKKELSKECSVCYENKIDCCLQCGHIICTFCANKLVKCPTCREVIVTRTKCYL